eukprot:scaffold315791_cov27-Tisochrysis_lutea.AAC.1
MARLADGTLASRGVQPVHRHSALAALWRTDDACGDDQDGCRQVGSGGDDTAMYARAGREDLVHLH